MMKNDIIEEVWRNRDKFAKQFNYNIDDMVAELQKSEQNPFSRLVDRRKLAPNHALVVPGKKYIFPKSPERATHKNKYMSRPFRAD